MQLFLSWSGDRSRAVAETLAKWLSQVVQAVEPWLSVDIEKGARWAPEVADRLEKSKVGIICLTRENLESRWILFEAGALSKTKDAYVCTFLLDLTPADVEPPLGQFQHTTFEKQDAARLVRTVNATVAREGEKALGESVLADVFETFWPQLETRLNAIAAAPPPETPPKRSQPEILDEILTTVRSLERRQSAMGYTSTLRGFIDGRLARNNLQHDRRHGYYIGAPRDTSEERLLRVLDEYFKVLARQHSDVAGEAEETDKKTDPSA